jgi:hypothetical protein
VESLKKLYATETLLQFIVSTRRLQVLPHLEHLSLQASISGVPDSDLDEDGSDEENLELLMQLNKEIFPLAVNLVSLDISWPLNSEENWMQDLSIHLKTLRLHKNGKQENEENSWSFFRQSLEIWNRLETLAISNSQPYPDTATLTWWSKGLQVLPSFGNLVSVQFIGFQGTFQSFPYCWPQVSSLHISWTGPKTYLEAPEKDMYVEYSESYRDRVAENWKDELVSLLNRFPKLGNLCLTQQFQAYHVWSWSLATAAGFLDSLEMLSKTRLQLRIENKHKAKYGKEDAQSWAESLKDAIANGRWVKCEANLVTLCK